MTNENDPFGRNDRTIIRPNPGGRRPAAAPAPPGAVSPAPPPSGGAPPVSAPTPPLAYPGQPPYAPPPPTGAPPQPQPRFDPPAGRTGEFDAWMSPRSPPNLYVAPAAAQPMTPAPLSPHVSVEVVTGSENPLVRASASLLLLLGRLRTSLAHGGAGRQLMDQVAQAIQQFEADARAGGAPPDQIQAAKYALAATADDIVQNLPSEDSRVWTQYSMLVRFFNERMGGVRFFDELERAKQNPAVNLGLLEVMHACLSLGFEGVYRASGGPGALQGVRRDLYETIRRARSKTIEELSPHWRGQTIPLAGTRFQLPVWAVAAAAGVILLGAYLYMRNALSSQAETLALRMEAIHPNTEVAITRETAVKPPPDPAKKISTQLQRIRAALASEIIAKQVDADQTAT
ncbi:MAG: type IVB secretion system protein IcmH/DotU, partial [Caulobacteraceae bacterium]|nr:type IVB secretion system protein IcmH/DotU [Caulobacteraceae bacterium]